jgi:hypothetical protein
MQNETSPLPFNGSGAGEDWTAKRLFDALDKARVATAAGVRRITVYSIVEQSGRRWIQLGLQRTQTQAADCMFTLTLEHGQGPEDLMRTLTDRLGKLTSHFPNVA